MITYLVVNLLLKPINPSRCCSCCSCSSVGRIENLLLHSIQFQCLSLPPSLLFSELNHVFFSSPLTTSFSPAPTFHFHSPHSKPNIHLQPPPNATNPTLTRSYHLRRQVHTLPERRRFVQTPRSRAVLLRRWFLRARRIPRSSSCIRNCRSMDLLGKERRRERESQESSVLRLHR